MDLREYLKVDKEYNKLEEKYKKEFKKLKGKIIDGIGRDGDGYFRTPSFKGDFNIVHQRNYVKAFKKLILEEKRRKKACK